MRLLSREIAARRGGISVKLTGTDLLGLSVENPKRGGALLDHQVTLTAIFDRPGRCSARDQ